MSTKKGQCVQCKGEATYDGESRTYYSTCERCFFLNTTAPKHVHLLNYSEVQVKAGCGTHQWGTTYHTRAVFTSGVHTGWHCPDCSTTVPLEAGEWWTDARHPRTALVTA